jgi:hypothetical protein
MVRELDVIKRLVKERQMENKEHFTSIINLSSKPLAEEAVNAILYKQLDEANDVLDEYNLKITKFDVEFDENGHVIKQTLTIEDFKR